MNKIATLIVIIIGVYFIISNLSNTFYYKSEDELVLAAASKSFFIQKEKAEFRSVILGFKVGAESVGDRYPAVYLKLGDKEIFNVANISKKDLMQIEGLAASENPYIPVDLEDGVKCFDIGCISIIRSPDLERTLRVSMSKWKDEHTPLKIGVKKNAMRAFPLSANDLEELFGDGEIYAALNL